MWYFMQIHEGTLHILRLGTRLKGGTFRSLFAADLVIFNTSQTNWHTGALLLLLLSFGFDSALRPSCIKPRHNGPRSPRSAPCRKVQDSSPGTGRFVRPGRTSPRSSGAAPTRTPADCTRAGRAGWRRAAAGARSAPVLPAETWRRRSAGPAASVKVRTRASMRAQAPRAARLHARALRSHLTFWFVSVISEAPVIIIIISSLFPVLLPVLLRVV